jgi:hypothetical protein
MSATHGLPGSPRRYDGKYTRPRMRAALAAAAEAYCGYMWAMGLKLLRVSGEWEDPEGDERIEYVNLNLCMIEDECACGPECMRSDVIWIIPLL